MGSGGINNGCEYLVRGERGQEECTQAGKRIGSPGSVDGRGSRAVSVSVGCRSLFGQ